MNSRDKQSGASIIFWLIALAVAGFALVIGLRLVPVYINAYMIQSILRDVATQSRGADTSPGEIWSSIDKRLDINDIDNISRRDFRYRQDRDGTTIAIKYQVRTELIGNLDAVAKFRPVEILNEPPD